MNFLRRFLKNFKDHFFIKDIKAITVPTINGNFLKNKTALIIGGNGGIGKAILKAFFDNGCEQIVITGTNSSKLQETCNMFNRNVNYVMLDLKDLSMLERKLGESIKLLNNHIDIMVYAAGIHGPSDFWKVTESDFDSVMDLNVKAMFFCCQIIAKHMRNNNSGGHILCVSSASALKPGKTPYEISKNAVKSMVLGMSQELISYGIVVNCLAPGPTATKMLARDNNESLRWPGNPSGRMATAEEIANWAVMMVSSIGDYVVGDSIYVSGGSGTICIDK